MNRLISSILTGIAIYIISLGLSHLSTEMSNLIRVSIMVSATIVLYILFSILIQKLFKKSTSL